MMRIITGKARGVKLKTLEGLDTRPTSERTKEAVFSMLQFDIVGKRVLDAFAGSGQMGLEALSRGATSAVFVDRSKQAVDIIRQNTELTRLNSMSKIFCCELEDYLKRSVGKNIFDIVFLDPPYASDLVLNALKGLTIYNALAKSAIVVCESGVDFDVLSDGGCAAFVTGKFDVVKKAQYGAAYITVLKFMEG